MSDELVAGTWTYNAVLEPLCVSRSRNGLWPGGDLEARREESNGKITGLDNGNNEVYWSFSDGSKTGYKGAQTLTL